MQRTFLFDMVHPADFHFFVGMISEVERRGDRSVVATRHNDVLVELADEAQIEHVVASTAGHRSRVREANELVTRAQAEKVDSSAPGGPGAGPQSGRAAGRPPHWRALYLRH